MVTNQQVISAAKSLGMEAVGFASHNGKSAVVCLFPYFSGYIEGANLSCYTYGEDYHTIVRQKLTALKDKLGLCATVHVDTGEPCDKFLAVQSGLCYLGDNSLAYHDRFGSYFFIGYLLCDEKFHFGAPMAKSCLHCRACEKACPGGAISKGKVNPQKCASAISQKKGELNENEIKILKKGGLVFGCDICQKVCPLNRQPAAPMAEFTKNIMPRISAEDVSLSNRAFLRTYQNRAFSWRGRGVLARNLGILKFLSGMD